MRIIFKKAFPNVSEGAMKKRKNAKTNNEQNSKKNENHANDDNVAKTFEGRTLSRQDEDIEDQGLTFDIGTLVSRRGALGVVGAGTVAGVLAACSVGSESSSGSSTSSASDGGGSTTSTISAGETPTETAGPYPGDGSNGADVLEVSGVERSDITKSIDSDTVADGVPMTLKMKIIDMVNDDSPMVGAAVYVWHCDAEGKYSMYSEGLEDETYLRGVQVTDKNGEVEFTSIIPACYSGRWPHIHFEVFSSVEDISDSTKAILTSQIALPEDVVDKVYENALYSESVHNMESVSLETDGIFSDGYETQLATMSGNVNEGYTASIDVNIDTTTENAMSGGMGGQGGGDGAGGGTPPSGGMPSDGGGDGNGPGNGMTPPGGFKRNDDSSDSDSSDSSKSSSNSSKSSSNSSTSKDSSSSDKDS